MMFYLQRFVGWVLYTLRFRPCFSISIANTMTAGYGELGDYGFWQYPVPSAFWLKRQSMGRTQTPSTTVRNK